MTWLADRVAEIRLRRTARQYGSRLGPYLARAYGPGEHYTAGQINAAVAALKLPAWAIGLGYAAFMPETQFAELGYAPGSYERLRSLVHRCAGTSRQPAFEPAAENWYAQSGSTSGHT